MEKTDLRSVLAFEKESKCFKTNIDLIPIVHHQDTLKHENTPLFQEGITFSLSEIFCSESSINSIRQAYQQQHQACTFIRHMQSRLNT